MDPKTATRERRSERFERRRSEILDVASDQINSSGLHGLTLTSVARALSLDTSSVTYYFRFKEDLAAACLQRSLDQLEAFADIAGGEAEPRERVRRFVAESVELFRRAREPGAPHLAVISEISVLDETARAPLDASYRSASQAVRGFFDPRADSARAVAANSLIANATWMSAWVIHYNTADLARVAERLTAVLLDGLEAAVPWSVSLESLEARGESQGRFLHAATNLINRHGYKGASVEKIAAEMGVSVGSFYHHLEGKDDLVIACFDRSFEVLDRACHRVEAAGGPCGPRLGALVSQLFAFQFSAESPLLRPSAFQALPPDLREKMLERMRAFTLHLSGLIADGVAEGSIRPVDPAVAGQCVLATVHAAADLRSWASKRTLQEAVMIALSLLRGGLC